MQIDLLFDSPEFCVQAGTLLSVPAIGLGLVALLGLASLGNLFIQDIAGRK